MGSKLQRYSVYLDPHLHKTLKLKAAETSQSVSGLINEAVRRSLAEDAEDLEAFEERVGESLVSYDEMLKRLKNNGQL